MAVIIGLLFLHEAQNPMSAHMRWELSLKYSIAMWVITGPAGFLADIAIGLLLPGVVWKNIWVGDVLYFFTRLACGYIQWFVLTPAIIRKVRGIARSRQK